MKKTICIAMLILMIFASLTTVAEADTDQEITVVDARGKTITFESPPERIVSFMASNTEILFHLGLGDRVVAVDDYSDYPEEVQELPKVGDAFGVNYELIVKMSADVVVTASYNAEMITYLEGIGQKVVATSATTVDDVYSDMEILGKMCGMESEAKEMADVLRGQMDQLTADTRGLSEQDRPKVLYVVSTFQGIWTTGVETFQNTLLHDAGAKNIAGEKTGWIALSEEEVLAADPEVIIAVDTVRAELGELLKKDSWSQIHAVKNDNIFYVDDNIMSRPGPRVVEAQEALVDIITGVIPEERIDEETPALGGLTVATVVAMAAIFKERKRRG